MVVLKVSMNILMESWNTGQSVKNIYSLLRLLNVAVNVLSLILGLMCIFNKNGHEKPNQEQIR